MSNINTKAYINLFSAIPSKDLEALKNRVEEHNLSMEEFLSLANQMIANIELEESLRFDNENVQNHDLAGALTQYEPSAGDDELYVEENTSVVEKLLNAILPDAAPASNTDISNQSNVTSSPSENSGASFNANETVFLKDLPFESIVHSDDLTSPIQSSLNIYKSSTNLTIVQNALFQHTNTVATIINEPKLAPLILPETENEISALNINFNDYTISSYGVSHDIIGTYFIEDGGQTLHLQDNTWKDIALNYTVTKNTVIEFDYFSTQAGEIHGIGFDKDESISHDNTFKIFGTQGWGRTAYNNYAGNEGEWVHYKIDVGDYYTGTFNRLFFVNDDDTDQGAVGYFTNVTIIEEGTGQSDTLHGTDSDQSLYGNGGDDVIYGYDGDDILYGGSGIDYLFGGDGADTFVFDSLDAKDYIGDFNIQEGDALDISALLSGYSPVDDAIADFVYVTSSNGSTTISIDTDGGADNFVEVVTLHGTSSLGSLQNLEDNGTLITI